MPRTKYTPQDSSIDTSKHLSEFYTKFPNAQLLAYCTLRFPNKDWNFGPSLADWQQFFVGDFACGEGTLLEALYLEFESIFKEQCARAGIPPNLNEFHKYFVENLCFGFDVVKSAISSALEKVAAIEPRLQNARSNFYVLPLGKNPAIRLGSLDFLRQMGTQLIPFKLRGSRISIPAQLQDDLPIHLPPFQIILLNPPYARSCGDNLLFGMLPKEDREVLTKELKRIRQKIGTAGIGQAGQAADFIYLAQQAVAPGGRFSFIVPKSFCFGPSWKKLRQFLAETVTLECIFFNFEYPHYGFSERTQLSECMVIARNITPNLGPPEQRGNKTLIVNILKSPTSEVDLTSLQCELVEIFVTGGDLPPSDRRTAFFLPQIHLLDCIENWAQPLGFYSPDLCRIHFNLIKNKILTLPRWQTKIQLPLTSLCTLGAIGYDRKQVTENTIEGLGPEKFPTVWGRDNQVFTMIQVKPTGFRHINPQKSPRFFQELQRSASHLLLPECTWLGTTHIFSILCTEPVVSNVFWTFTPVSSLQTADGKPISQGDIEQILALWGNSTLGILLFLGIRQETRGPWVHWKKRLLAQMLTLDLSKLLRSQVDSLLEVSGRFLPRETLFDDTFLPALLAGKRLNLDLSILQILQEPEKTPLSPASLKDILSKLYHSFSNPELNRYGLA